MTQKPKKHEVKWRKVYETRFKSAAEVSFRVMDKDCEKDVELVKDGADYLLRVWKKSVEPNNHEIK